MISTESRDGVSVVRLNRPEGHNSLVPEMAERLVEHLRAAAALQQPVILTASGSSFCPGADLKWLASCGDPAQGVADLVAIHHLAIVTLLEMPVPVVAAVNGSVAGGGLGLMLAADYRVASDQATFTAGYFRLALTPDGGSSAFLERMIGPARTLELLLTNRSLTAREANDWGMVSEVAPDAAHLERAIAFADGLERVPGYALLQTRQLVDTINIRNQLQLESVAIRTAARGSAFRDALKVFVEAHPS